MYTYIYSHIYTYTYEYIFLLRIFIHIHMYIRICLHYCTVCCRALQCVVKCVVVIHMLAHICGCLVTVSVFVVVCIVVCVSGRCSVLRCVAVMHMNISDTYFALPHLQSNMIESRWYYICTLQARLSDLHCESLNRENSMVEMQQEAVLKQSARGNPFLCSGGMVSNSESR